MARDRLEIAVKNLEFARRYTISLLNDFDEADWFRQPAEGITHLGWQVGHLAMAEYALTMIRLRGKEPEDQEFISNDFFKRFKKGTSPEADANAYPSPAEIRRVFDQVHEHTLRELAGYDDAQLDVKLPEPHAVFDTKMGSVYFCSAHEMLHAGQIGLLRRLLGSDPLR